MKAVLKKLVPHRVQTKYHAYKKKKIAQAYAGDAVNCTICDSSYLVFGAFGLEKRNNAECHNCGSLEHHRLIWKYIQDKQLLDRPVSILHFAPEKVFYDIFSVAPNVEYYPCDLMPELYDHKGKTKVIKADITQIPFEDNRFDFVLCNHVLEHIPDDHLAMTELRRVMKPDGFGIFQVPIDYNRAETYEDFSITTPEGRLEAFGQHDHVRCYGCNYKKRLSKAGFDALEDNYVTTFSKSDQFKYGFVDTEMIYLCKKQ